jgi:hypothetical protein
MIFKALLISGILMVLNNTLMAQEEKNSDEGKKECDHHSYRGMKGMRIEKMGDDSLVVYIDKKEWDEFPMKHFPFGCRKGKYNGHWAGVELGWNGYTNSDFNMDFPGTPYMDMNVARSMMVNLNPFELNLNLVKNHFGFTSGLGFQLSNYYFTGNYKLIEDSTNLVAYGVYDDKGKAADLTVNKLFVAWMNVPVLFEYQTNNKMRWNSFHVSVGVIGGLRISTYTKQTFDTWNTFYDLKDNSGTTVGSFYTDKKYVRDRGAYHLQNFKLDATARIGWSFLNFWGTYSLTPMFMKDHGPELYPWTIGITLVGW